MTCRNTLRGRSRRTESEQGRTLAAAGAVAGLAVVLSVLFLTFLNASAPAVADPTAGIPRPASTYFAIGPFHVRFYAVAVLSGVVVAIWLTSRRLTSRGGPRGATLDIALWTVIFGIVGGRIYHVVTHPGDYFFPGADLFKAVAVWDGGLAIFGAVIFGTLGAAIGCKRAGVRFFAFADALAPALLVAQGVGRVGCYFAEELYGAPTTLPWGLHVSQMSPAFPAGLPADTLFQPLFLYESVWNLVGAAVILVAERKVALGWGRTIGLYLIWYGIGRTWLEALRLDPTEFLLAGTKINLVAAAAAALAGGILILVQTRRHAGPPSTVLVARSSTLTAGSGVGPLAPNPTAVAPLGEAASAAPLSQGDTPTVGLST